MASPNSASPSMCRVWSYAGYKADERPVAFSFHATVIDIVDIEDRWYSPSAEYFRVFAADANRYLLCHDTATDQWTVRRL